MGRAVNEVNFESKRPESFRRFETYSTTRQGPQDSSSSMKAAQHTQHSCLRVASEDLSRIRSQSNLRHMLK